MKFVLEKFPGVEEIDFVWEEINPSIPMNTYLFADDYLFDVAIFWKGHYEVLE